MDRETSLTNGTKWIRPISHGRYFISFFPLPFHFLFPVFLNFPRYTIIQSIPCHSENYMNWMRKVHLDIGSLCNHTSPRHNPLCTYADTMVMYIRRKILTDSQIPLYNLSTAKVCSPPNMDWKKETKAYPK